MHKTLLALKYLFCLCLAYGCSQEAKTPHPPLERGVEERIKSANGFEDLFEVVSTLELSTPAGMVVGFVDVMAEDSHGRLYLRDRTARLVYLFDENGRFVKQVGGRGKGEGEYESTGALLFDDESKTLYHYDNSLLRMTTFDEGGAFLRSFSTKLDLVTHIYVARGSLNLFRPSTWLDHTIYLVDANGTVVTAFGETGLKKEEKREAVGGAWAAHDAGFFYGLAWGNTIHDYSYSGERINSFTIDNPLRKEVAYLPNGTVDVLSSWPITGVFVVRNQLLITQFTIFGKPGEQAKAMLDVYDLSGHLIKGGFVSDQLLRRANTRGDFLSITYPPLSPQDQLKNPTIVRRKFKLL
ncbi:MAG: 6-bladed beta-propeller [Bacteroidetes bacterium]|nr:6-bladed beta-propeller [Bacteroidota bacterium]MCW5896479.1 6-bladed beta-propeller [Bacteroidota bacterium]